MPVTLVQEVTFVQSTVDPRYTVFIEEKVQLIKTVLLVLTFAAC